MKPTQLLALLQLAVPNTTAKLLADARDDFARHDAVCDHNEMVETDSPTHAWKCAKCGYIYS
jgi:hypothetical protein